MSAHSPKLDRAIRTIAVVGVTGPLRDYITGAFRMPLLGSVLVGTALRNAGYEVRVFCESVRSLQRSDLDWIVRCEMVCVGCLTFGADRAYALAWEIRRRNPTTILVLGDVHASVMPVYSLGFFDYVFRGEGEAAILDLMRRLADGGSLNEISGLSFVKGDGTIQHNPDRREGNFHLAPDMRIVEGMDTSDRNLIIQERRRNMAILQATRGCPVGCSFCLGSAILGRKYRKRDIDDVMANLRLLREWAGQERRIVFFVDNHLFVDRRFTIRLLRRLIQEAPGFAFIGFAQYHIGKDPEVLALVKEAGFIRIFMGFESVNPETLREFRKPQSESEMRECIQACHEAGVSIHGSFMFGGETDTYEVVDRTVQFALETELTTASFFALTEYPFEQYSGAPQVGVLSELRLLSDRLEHYNSNLVTFLPRLMRPSTLQQKIVEAYTRFFSPRRLISALCAKDWFNAYHRIAGWNGSRQLVQQMREHVHWLEERESQYYNDSDQLRSDVPLPLPGPFRWSGHSPYASMFFRPGS